MIFYDRVSELCKDHGVSMAAVAREIGLSNSATTYWKRGSVPKGDTLQKLADYFGVSTDYLLGKTDFPYPDMTGRTERYEPWTQADEMVLRAGGFRAVAEFNFLSEEDKVEALKDINKFVEFTLSKYKQQETPLTPIPHESEGKDAPSQGPPPETPENAEER